jgi:hypothetical protein
MNQALCRNAVLLLALLTGIAGAFPAQAAYEYTSVDYPGATLTQLFGSTDSGKFVGDAMIGSTQIGFVYDAKKRAFTPLPNVPGAPTTNAIGINNAGVIVGSAGNGDNDQGIILDKGAFSFFVNPGWALTQARSISANSRLITGLSSTGTNYVGFIYDVEHDTFTNFLPSEFTIAQGINGRRDVVGNVTLEAGVAYPGAPADSYGFLRQRDGALRLFGVTGGSTVRARGINNSGLITGFFTDANGVQRGFVARLAAGPSFQSLSIPDNDLLDVPGSARTLPETISDRGDVAGNWFDSAGTNHAFIATPLSGKK